MASCQRAALTHSNAGAARADLVVASAENASGRRVYAGEYYSRCFTLGA